MDWRGSAALLATRALMNPIAADTCEARTEAMICISAGCRGKKLGGHLRRSVPVKDLTMAEHIEGGGHEGRENE